MRTNPASFGVLIKDYASGDIPVIYCVRGFPA